MSNFPLMPFGWMADSAACGTYRVSQPLTALHKKFGNQVEFSAGKATLPWNVLVAQRTHKEDCIQFLEVIRKERKAELPLRLVYELDDNLWAIERSNPGHEYFLKNSGNIIKAIQLCDMVTVSTLPLAKVMTQYHHNVRVLPNSIPKRFVNEIRYPYKIHEDKPFVLGFVGGASHLDDFRTIASSVSTFLRLNPNSRIAFIGSSYANLLHSSVQDQVMESGWFDSVDRARDFTGRAGIDVMLAPLAANTFNESKSNLRLIEAGAFGIPVIATKFGPYIDAPVTHVEPGDSWLTAISEMQGNPWMRLSASQVMRSWVETNFIQEDTVDMWHSAYKELLDA